MISFSYRKTLIFILLWNWVLPVVCRSIPMDSIGPVATNRISYWRPALDILAVNIITNRTNLYLRQKKWSDVSLSSWKRNLETGIITDGDNFGTNWLGHPFGGSFFYNCARKSGVDYLRSIPYILGGSVMWEYFGETEPASEIDLNTTFFGGAYLGEITYKLSDYIWNNPTFSRLKVIKHISGTIINPVMGLNRLLFGYTIPVTEQSYTPIKGRFYVGSNFLFNNFNSPGWKNRSFVEFQLSYGNLYDLSKSTLKPFDYFTLRTWVNLSGSPAIKPYLSISSHAIISASKITNTVKKMDIISISQHYDYVNNELYRLGAVGITGDIWIRRANELLSLSASVKGGILLFGSTDSKFAVPVRTDLFPEFSRDYVYGPGLMAESQVVCQIKKTGTVAAYYNYYQIKSKDPNGTERVHMYRFRYQLDIGKRLNIGLQYGLFARNSNYKIQNCTKCDAVRFNELNVVAGYNL